MSKIKTIKVQNIKAISEQQADFNGCTAIVFGGNGKGKTTLLRSLTDRIRGIKPEIIVKQGEKDGVAFVELTTGEQFIWSINESGKEKLTFITREGIKTSVTKEIAARFFPPVFDIDSFLQSGPKKQSEILQKLAGIDFLEINAKYKIAYDERTFANRKESEAKAKLLPIDKNLPKEELPTDELVKELSSIELHNQTVNQIIAGIEERNKDIIRINEEIETAKTDRDRKILELHRQIEDLKAETESTISIKNELISAKEADIKKGNDWLKTPGHQLKDAEYTLAKQSELETINNNNELIIANNKAIQLQIEADEAKNKAIESDEVVKAIESEKANLLKSANMPDGFSITDDGVTIDGLPLERNQLSTSKIYISALKLAALNLGEVRCLHFDASPLDRTNLIEIENWAKENDLQLLIEKPDFDGGDIKYEIYE